ncbi:Hypothetical predicted protein [Octopus vulgaris]|uniref:Uncharacterized protein n=1 Tax=Octopus vulgaris TaxID=6645 RepID=A0AA36AX60_OCTVU|nr:Hypothetical predicted protein [Octopus vulgaris]
MKELFYTFTQSGQKMSVKYLEPILESIFLGSEQFLHKPRDVTEIKIGAGDSHNLLLVWKSLTFQLGYYIWIVKLPLRVV